MEANAITVQEPPARMNPQSPDAILEEHIVSRMEEKIRRCRQQTPENYTIFTFPDSLVDIDDRIKLPRLASLGPRYHGQAHLLPFDEYKFEFLSKFLSRTESLGRGIHFYFQKLQELKESIKGCYSEKIVMPSDDDELRRMMLLDGSFIIELFREYEEGRDVTRTWHVQTLIADLLKLENQLPFFVLKKLFDFSNIGQDATIQTLSTLALRFFRQAFSCPLDSQIQHPKHLLDLFRSSLLPSPITDPQQSNHHPSVHSIQSVNQLRCAGITVRQKTAKSLLEIDFRKFQIPPLALKIPPVAMDDCTSSILVNCVALEQCLPRQSKHFTAYVCFMNCLMKQPEDVRFLRTIEIITHVSQDELCFIDMLNSLGRNLSFSVRDGYLRKQFREIHSYYNSSWASIRRNLFSYNNIMLYCSILQIAIGILSWRLSAK